MGIEAKKLKYEILPGLSEKQLREHHDVLYVGYVNKLAEIREIHKAADKSKANATFSDFRELKLEESFALDAVILHEYYFDNLGGNSIPSAFIESRLARDFGSFESWQEDLIASGLSARGWVVLAEDIDGTLRHFVCDTHNQGGIWGYRPILVLDVYEHAYFIDYGTNRKEYLNAFLKNLDWKVVEDRLRIISSR